MTHTSKPPAARNTQAGSAGEAVGHPDDVIQTEPGGPTAIVKLRGNPIEELEAVLRHYSPQAQLEANVAEVRELVRGLASRSAAEHEREAEFRREVAEHLSELRDASKRQKDAGGRLDVRATERLQALYALVAESLRKDSERQQAHERALREIKGALAELGKAPAATNDFMNTLDELRGEREVFKGRFYTLVKTSVECLRKMEEFFTRNLTDEDERERLRPLYEGVAGLFANLGIVGFEPEAEQPFNPSEHETDGDPLTKIRGTEFRGYRLLDEGRVLIRAKVF